MTCKEEVITVGFITDQKKEKIKIKKRKENFRNSKKKEEERWNFRNSKKIIRKRKVRFPISCELGFIN